MEVHELIEDYNNYYIASELCEGGEVYNRLMDKDAPFTNDNAAFIIY